MNLALERLHRENISHQHGSVPKANGQCWLNQSWKADSRVTWVIHNIFTSVLQHPLPEMTWFYDWLSLWINYGPMLLGIYRMVHTEPGEGSHLENPVNPINCSATGRFGKQRYGLYMAASWLHPYHHIRCPKTQNRETRGFVAHWSSIHNHTSLHMCEMIVCRYTKSWIL